MLNNSSTIKTYKLDNLIYFLVILLPFTLVSGPFLPDLSISIITLIFIFIAFKKKIYFYFINIYSKIFGLFFIFLILTSLFSLDPLISLKKTVFFLDFGYSH